MPLSSYQLRAILANELQLRGADVLTIDKDRLEQLEEEIGMAIVELSHCYIATVYDIDVDDPTPTDVIDPPSDQWPVPPMSH